ncbi:unnamed protein product [Brassica rapa subsp. narinosa]|uniref:Fe2OG dioxygenase domain-containing protein n=1 Tax=Brassica campestris TaxID=3711 RepID=M4CBZ9_BRACM|nr:unnamed protein product [Brassica rapa]
MGVLDEAFIQAPEHRPKTHLKHSDDHILSKEIPTIDLSSLQDPNCDKTALATEIAEACMRWGFFQVINHGLSLDLMRRVEKTVAEFFSLTLEEKRRVKRDEVNPMGYHDGEHTKNVRDWKEIFDFFLQDSTTVPATTEPEDTELRKLTNPWPQNPSDFREVCQEYAREVEKLAFKLLELISISLGLPGDRLTGYFKDQTSFLRFNHYPPCPNPELALGVGRHADAGVITVLAQDSVGGLQVSRRSDGQWFSVKPNPDAFIINIGNCMQRVPDKFVSRFKDELSVAVALTVPDGHVWRVGLRKADNNNKIWFQDGWQEFVDRYSIRIGYLLIFRYEGNSAFSVCIYNLPQSEINYHSTGLMDSASHNNHFKRPRLFEDLEDEDAETLHTTASAIQSFFTGPVKPEEATPTQTSKVPKKRGRKKKNADHPEEVNSSAPRDDDPESRSKFYESASARKRTVNAEERERAVNAAKTFEPTNPFFRVVLRPSYLYRGCIMYLPSGFAEKYLSGISGFIKVQLGEKQWPVRCLYKAGRAKFSQGWYEFTVENNLGEGDVCVFELLRTRDFVLKVTAYRVNEYV